MTATCAFVSFRLGGTDGVSVAAAGWQRCLSELGWRTVTIAGDGVVDRRVAGLEIGAEAPPDRAELAAALADADLVIAENILTIPLNLAASRELGRELRGRPAVLHHHDPPWQRKHFAHVVELPPDDPAWRHVTVNSLTEHQFRRRGMEVTTIYNGFDTTVAAGDRGSVRRRLGLADDDRLVLHPVRAIARKNVPGAVAMTEAVGGVYWLPGPAEDGYGSELDRILAAARCPVLRTAQHELGAGTTMADLYAASDLVAFPSLWEGFGNPPIEAAVHRRPVAVGRYPVADELRQLGFRWLDPTDTEALCDALAGPPTDLLEHNRRIAEQHLSLDALGQRVKALLDRAGWSP